VLPPTDGIMFTGESIKVVARPSGTEPKLKCYLEARVPPGERPLDRARADAAQMLDQLRSEMAAALGVAH
jgi:phosphomannomutase